MSGVEPDHAQRRQRLRSALEEHDCPAALITDLINLRYLSGFTGSNAALLVSADGADLLSTDGRYTEQAAAESPDLEVVVARACADTLLGRIAVGASARVGFEAHRVTVQQHADWQRDHDTIEFVALGPAVERLRTVKDDYELDRLREACAVGDRALAALIPLLAVGQTEREVAQRLDRLMVDHGGDAVGFETIAATGPNSSIPHHQPTDRRIELGDFLKLDFGAKVDGYHADMTRTLVVAAQPSDWQRETYELVREAQAAGRAALAPGVDVRDVDRAARSIIEEAGLGECFPHGLGHGVGLQIHEDPFIGTGGTGTLAAGIPVTVEPGVYHPGRGGVRIEDTLVVTSGGPELLTTTTKELLVVGR